MSEPRELLERARGAVNAVRVLNGLVGIEADIAHWEKVLADIDAYLAAPPAQPPRVTAEMVRRAHDYAPLAYPGLNEETYQRMADALNARLSAEREPPTNPASVSSTLGVEAEREPGEAGTKHG